MIKNVPFRLRNNEFRFIKVQVKEKRAFEPNWQFDANYRWDDIRLQNHFAMDGNYGVVGGFGGLVIIDCDVPEIIDEVKANLPKTFSVKTSKGLHLYYICKDLNKPIRLMDENKINVGDVQSKGKYVVGPFCTHPSGKKYKIVENIPISEVKAEEIRFALKKWIIKKEEVDYSDEKKSIGMEEDLDIRKVIRISNLEKRGNEHYGSHPIHGSKGKMNFWVNTSKNLWHCFRHDSGGNALTWVAVKEGVIKCNAAVPGCLSGDTFKKVAKIAKEKYGLKLKEIKDKEDISKIINEIADELLEKFYIKTIYNQRGNKTIWVYNKGVYRSNGLGFLENEIEHILGEKSTNHKVSEIIGKIQRITRIDKDIFFEEQEGVVLLENGVFDLKEQKLKQFTTNHYFTRKIPLTYDPNAKCPKIMKFINETFYKDNIQVIQEWIGFQLYNKYFIKKAVIIYGPKDTGKSVFLNLVTAFIGKENTGGLSLQEISWGKGFNMTNLYKKYSNIHDDLSGKDLKETGKFKMAVGDGYISAEYKFGDRFKFLNYAKHTFACNKIPMNEEVQDDAYWSRWIPIAVENQVVSEEVDEFLIKKLTTKEELSGLLNWSLEGLKRILKTGKFSYNKSSDEIKNTMMRYSTPLVAFVQDVIIKKDGNKINKDVFYNIYSHYCEQNNYPRLSKVCLSRRIKKLVPYINEAHDTKRHWIGVETKVNLDELDDFKNNNACRESNSKESNKVLYLDEGLNKDVDVVEGSKVIRITKDIEKFKNPYNIQQVLTFKREDVVRIPKKLADLLIKKEYAMEIKG